MSGLKTSVCKITTEGNKNYHIIISWDENLQVTFIDNERYWKGDFTKEQQEYFSKNLSMTNEEYDLSMKDALSSKDARSEYIYQFKENKLIWLKVIDEDSGFKMRYGNIEFNECTENGGTEMLVDVLMDMNKDAERVLCQREIEMKEMETQMKDLLAKFKEFSELKTHMEQDLYVKFITLLNTKKQKIASLEEYLQEISSLGTKKETQNIHSISDSD